MIPKRKKRPKTKVREYKKNTDMYLDQSRRHGKSKKKILLMTIAIVLVILIGIDIGISNYLINFALINTGSAGSSITTTLNVSADQEQAALEEKANANKERLTEEAVSWASKTGQESISITSEDDLKLVASLYTGDNSSSHKWAILLHGYNGSSIDMITYAKAFNEEGYQVITPDQRSAGQSQGSFTSMGWFEKDDLELWIDYVIERDPDAQIVLEGISMGAATVMMASGDTLPSNVKVIIEDCGYTSVWDEFANKLNAVFHLPTFPILNSASLMTDLRMGFNFTEASSVNQLAKNETPMLFIHGSADDYNPFWMEDVLYEADANDQKEKVVVEGARHAMSAFTDTEAYWDHVWNFIGQYMSE